MKLLFDQNLSFKLCRKLFDVFPGSNQVRLLGMAEADDREIWYHAKVNDFVLVSQDVDFAEMATLYGPPPKSSGCVAGTNPPRRLKNDSAITPKQFCPSFRATLPRVGKSIEP